MLNQRGGARTDTVIKLVLIFFISLLSFSVGTFVGKQFNDSQHKLASMEAQYRNSHDMDRETASIPPGQLDVKPEDALTDEDIHKLSEEFASHDGESLEELVEEAPHDTKEAHAKDGKKKAVGHKESTHQPASHNEHNAKDAHQGALSKETAHQIKNIQKAAERIANGKEPLEPTHKPQPRGPSSLPGVANSTVGKFTVQVSSFKTEEEATRAAEKLKSKGYSAFYLQADVKGATWYRVSVGLFVTRQEALDYRTRLLGEGIASSAIVQKIVQ